MTSTSFPRFVLLLAIILVGNALPAQSIKEAVILYNSQAVLAKISTDGEVKEIIRDESGYLQGFTLKVQDYGQFLANQEKLKSYDKVILPSKILFLIKIKIIFLFLLRVDMLHYQIWLLVVWM